MPVQDIPQQGDVNLDGELTLVDVVALQKYLLGVQPLTNEQRDCADLEQDGRINAFDLAILKKRLLKK